MSLIKKIDVFTSKRIKSIKKYINEINQVQSIKKQLGGTESSINELLSELDSVSIDINNLSKRTIQQIITANQIIKRLEEENKEISENLIKKTKEIEEVQSEMLEKYKVLSVLLEQQNEEIFKVNIEKLREYFLSKNILPKVLLSFDTLPNDYKKRLLKLTEADALSSINYSVDENTYEIVLSKLNKKFIEYKV